LTRRHRWRRQATLAGQEEGVFIPRVEFLHVDGVVVVTDIPEVTRGLRHLLFLPETNHDTGTIPGTMEFGQITQTLGVVTGSQTDLVQKELAQEAT